MSRKRYSLAEIINKLREAKVLLSQDETGGQAVWNIGVSEPTRSRRARPKQVKNLEDSLS